MLKINRDPDKSERRSKAKIKNLTASYIDFQKNKQKSPDEMLDFRIKDDDLTVWYAKITHLVGENDEFVDGEYLVEVTATNDFPTKPPDFKFLTPNGVYAPRTRVCIDIGAYHAENYPATLGMVGFTKMLISGLIGYVHLGHGINLIETSIDKKKLLALESREYNRTKNSEIIALFDTD